MNRLLVLLPFTFCLGYLLCGCASTPAVDADRLARIAGRSAYLGARLWLRGHPEDKPKILAAVAALKVVEAMSQPDAAALAAALENLPTKEFRGDDGALLIEGACFIWDEILAERIPINRSDLVKKTAPQIRAGLERAAAAHGAVDP
jgi:hypothetical protein